MKIFQGGHVRKDTFSGAADRSTMRCAGCGNYITKEQEDIFFGRFYAPYPTSCNFCVNWFNGQEKLIADIHPSSGHLADSAEAKGALWFHATDRADWMGDLMADKDNEDGSVAFVHVGTWDAAQNIIADKYSRSEGSAYLYAVRLAPNAVVDANLYEDEDDWPDRTNEINSDANAFRYVNRWEATGSISLLVDPKHLVIEKMAEVAK